MWQWIFSEIPRWSNDVNILLSISYYCPLDADFPHHCIPAPLIPRKMNEGEFFHYKSNVIANMAINDNSPKGSLDRPVQDLGWIFIF